MAKLGSMLKTPFSFLFPGSAKEDRVAQYVIREHSNGRSLDEILGDHYVQNRLTPAQQARMLDRPDVIDALGRGAVDSARQNIASAG
jgi:hypothetical protein